MIEKSKNVITSFKYAFQGVFSAIKTERNLKIHISIMILVIIAGIFFKISKMEWIICIILFGLVIGGEMLNSAIETVVDIAMPEINPKAKFAKDVAAGAVVLAACNALVVGYFIFFNKENIKAISDSIFNNMVKSPTHLAFVAILLVIIAVIAIKASCSRKKQRGELIKEGFVPSGQTAIAFAALTAIWINSRDIITFSLALVLSVLIAGNRLYNNARTKAEVAFGACMGILIVILVYGLTIFKL